MVRVNVYGDVKATCTQRVLILLEELNLKLFNFAILFSYFLFYNLYILSLIKLLYTFIQNSLT